MKNFEKARCALKETQREFAENVVANIGAENGHQICKYENGPDFLFNIEQWLNDKIDHLFVFSVRETEPSFIRLFSGKSDKIKYVEVICKSIMEGVKGISSSFIVQRATIHHFSVISDIKRHMPREVLGLYIGEIVKKQLGIDTSKCPL